MISRKIWTDGIEFGGVYLVPFACSRFVGEKRSIDNGVWSINFVRNGARATVTRYGEDDVQILRLS